MHFDAKEAALGRGIAEQTIDMNLPPEIYGRPMQSALKLQRRLTLEPNAAELCIVAIDQNTGRTGSVHIPVEKNRAKQQ